MILPFRWMCAAPEPSSPSLLHPLPPTQMSSLAGKRVLPARRSVDSIPPGLPARCQREAHPLAPPGPTMASSPREASWICTWIFVDLPTPYPRDPTWGGPGATHWYREAWPQLPPPPLVLGPGALAPMAVVPVPHASMPCNHRHGEEDMRRVQPEQGERWYSSPGENCLLAGSPTVLGWKN